MSSTPVITSSGNPFTKFFSKVGHEIIVVASKIKSIFIAAAKEDVAITNFLQTYGMEADALLTAAGVPGADAIYHSAMTVWGAVANIIDKGGAAAEKNLLDQGLDQATIDSVKQGIQTVRSVAGPKPTPSA